MYKNAGRNKTAVMKEVLIVVKKRMPNLFKIATLHIIKKKPEKQEVNAPPRIVGPIWLKAYSVFSFRFLELEC